MGEETMAAIKFIKFYTLYGREYAEIVYESGKYRGAAADALPKTAAAWLEGKDSFEYYSVVYNRSETIYASDTDIERYREYAVPGIKNIRVHKDEHGKRTAYVEI